MGPRLLSRGNGRRNAGRERRSENGFNGATAVEPWKLHRGSSEGNLSIRGFNGATAVEPWKSGRGPLPALALRGLQWGHGW